MKQYIVMLVALLCFTNESAKAGADVGGTIEYFSSSEYACYDDLVDCLDEITVILDRAAGIANKFAAKKQYVSARTQIMIGVRKALSFVKYNDFVVFPSLTVIGLLRTQDLDRVFTNSCSSQECYAQDRRAFNALKIYVGHIRKNVYPLDVDDYYKSMSAGYCPDCHNGGGYNDPWEVFLERYKDSAVELLKYITGKYENSMPQILARDDYEARVSELVFKWSSEDIARDDMRRLYRFEYQLLRRAANDLNAFNKNLPNPFMNAQDAVNYSRAVAEEALSSLSAAQCNSGDGNLYEHYKTYDGRRGSVYSHYLNRLPRRVQRNDNSSNSSNYSRDNN